MPRASKQAGAKAPVNPTPPIVDASTAPAVEASVSAIPASVMQGGEFVMTELGPRPIARVLGMASDGKPVLEQTPPKPISASDAMHRVIEPGYVPPEMRMNPEYLAAKKIRDDAARDLTKNRPIMPGFSGGTRIIGMSPNMAKNQAEYIF